MKAAGPMEVLAAVRTGAIAILGLLAFAVGMFPVCWKIYETSYSFREASDPSSYDDVKEYFAEEEGADLPFVERINSDKHAYRVYFFVVPFVIGSCVAAAKLFLAAPSTGYSHRRTPWSHRLRPVLNFYVKLPKFLTACGLPSTLSVLDMAVVLVLLLLNVLLVWSRTDRSLTRGAGKLEFLKEDSKEPIPGWSWGCVEILAKTLGIVSIVNLAWFLMAPIGRRSVFLEMLHISWERAVKYHRWLGFWTCAVTWGHFLLYFIIWAEHTGHSQFDPESKMLRHNMLAWGCSDGSCNADARVLLMRNMYGLIALACMLIMCVFSLSFFRRRYFELFWYMHHLYLPMLLFLCFHYSSAILYLAPGIVFHLLDKLLGLLAYSSSVRARVTQVSSDVLELRIPQAASGTALCRTGCKAGQYVFLNVPQLSLLQWHPMSVTWATEEDFVLHVKALGEWTQRLYEQGAAKEELLVKVDGFYGKDAWESLSDKSALLLWAGGIGLTYCYSIALAACREGRPVFLRWVVRSESELLAFRNLLQDLKQLSPELVDAKVWWTKAGAEGQKPQDTRRAASKGATSLLAHGLPPAAAAAAGAFESQLWPRAFHALVAAAALLMGLLGYAVAREAVSSREDAGLPENFTWSAFVDLLYVCLFAAMLLAGTIAIWLAARAFHRRQRGKKGSASAGGAEPNAADPGEGKATAVPVVEGCRPDIAAEFQEIDAELMKLAGGKVQSIGVCACGPLAMVYKVQDQCRERLLAVHSWDFDLEEWEW